MIIVFQASDSELPSSNYTKGASGAASQKLAARVIGAGACSEGEGAKFVGREYPFSTGLDEGKWTFCGQSAIHAIFDCKSCKP